MSTETVDGGQTRLGERVTTNVKMLMAVRGFEHQKALAAALKWDESKLTRSLRNKRWQLEDLSDIAAALAVDVADLLRDPSTLLPANRSNGDVAGSVTPQYVPRNVQILGKNRRSGPRTTICADRKDISSKPARQS